jgi:trimeric autotransporter adhesin
MYAQRVLFAAICSALGLIGGLAADRSLANPVEPVTSFVAEPLLAIESARPGILNRLLADHAEEIVARGFDPMQVRELLGQLRADQLLAASLVDTLDDVLDILDARATDASAARRYVAVNPVAAPSFVAVTGADTYVVRDGDLLVVVRSADLASTGASAQVVGYFVPVSATMAVVSRSSIPLKDGAGTGTNSWIGYLAGNNIATGSGSSVWAGTFNQATAQGAFVGAGASNAATGISSLVIGGFDNRATAIDSLVGSGAGNRAIGARSIVVGGGYNLASGGFSFVGGGGRDGVVSTPAGTDAKDNVASGSFSVVTGGQGNRATALLATVGGGATNTANAQGAVIGGGGAPGSSITLNSILYDCGASGCGNRVTDAYGTVAGGFNNQAGNAFGTDVDRILATVSGGYGNSASGYASVVPGGTGNHAAGSRSFAAGRRAKTRSADGTIGYAGVFMFSDNNDFDFTGIADNEFAVRSTGGARFVTAIDGAGIPTAGVTLGAGASAWTTLSDRRAKDDFALADGRTVLAKVAAMPVYTWRYRSEASQALHMGPVAQDFRAAFGLGDGDTRISTVDADGVALAAIQGLNQKLDATIAASRAKDAEIALLRDRVAALETLVANVEALKATVVRMQLESPPLPRISLVNLAK